MIKVIISGCCVFTDSGISNFARMAGSEVVWDPLVLEFAPELAPAVFPAVRKSIVPLFVVWFVSAIGILDYIMKLGLPELQAAWIAARLLPVQKPPQARFAARRARTRPAAPVYISHRSTPDYYP